MLNYKAQAQRQWTRTPCGTGDFLGSHQRESLSWFDEIRRSRYEVSDTWMPRTIDFGVARGKKLLEIGHGIGSDLLTFCEYGAQVYGIDLTQEHHRLAKRNFQLHDRHAELKLCDAANIDYPDEFFDVVYSHGVLHHTPDTERCVAEAYRVLKPGGRFLLGMYHKYSAFHICSKVLGDGLLRGRLFTLGYRGVMATLERGADGKEIKPLVKTYSSRQMKRLLSSFSSVTLSIAHFEPNHIPLGTRFFPASLARRLEGRYGWYILANAVK